MSIGFLRYEEEQKEVARREGKIEGELLGRREGELLGIRKGKFNEKIEMAKKMLLLDIDLETIMKITELDKEIIENLCK